MSKSLVIVESPAKAKTISKFLGRGYTVKASVGHVRDLPRSQFGVDVDDNFRPKYITIRGKGDTLKELRTAAKKAKRVLLATDPDREGEAISWHLAEALNLENGELLRIEFNEITKSAVKNALKDPRPIDANLVNAYQARRILDRLVGYKLSPLLWAKVKRGLSAGRVQSVALRLICDREREVQAFVPEEYWSITAQLQPPGTKATFAAKVFRHGGKKVAIGNEAEAQTIVDHLRQASFRVEKVARKERRRNPAPPFTTSTLQQEASRRLNFNAGKTMRVAQQLYEGLDIGSEGTVGLVTYIRTDATRVANEAQAQARSMIESRYGKEYRPARPFQYKTKAGAQAAHEAIRPTSVTWDPATLKEHLSRDQHRLYRLIWERFLASQMSPAVLDTVTVDVQAGDYTLRATGSTVKFPGFMVLYTEQKDEESEEEEGRLPELQDGQDLKCRGIEPKQHFTQPPPRFTEAMLVRTLEELGIGRPSTYAAIIDTIRRRGYVRIDQRRFTPTELGFVVLDLLKEYFPGIIDVEFTASVEQRLDQIEEGEFNWVQALHDFYAPFAQQVEKAYENMEEVAIEDEVTDEICEHCGRNMVIKWGRFGKFLACPGFPDCRNTKPILHEIGVPCPECDAALVERRSRRGRTFYGCSAYPKCEFVLWQRPVAEKCPRCDFLLVEKRKRGQVEALMCGRKECDFTRAPSPVEDAAARA